MYCIELYWVLSIPLFTRMVMIFSMLSSALEERSSPLFEIQLRLDVPDIIFCPSLDFGASNNFSVLFESMINDVYRVASLMSRVAEHCSSPHYQVLSYISYTLIQIQLLSTVVYKKSSNISLKSEASVSIDRYGGNGPSVRRPPASEGQSPESNNKMLRVS